jgi:hypothetical protein
VNARDERFTAEIDAPVLGQPVTFTRTLTRRTEYRDRESYGRKVRDRWKVWKWEHYPGQPEPEPQSGVLIGIRTLANGRAEYEHDAGVVFYPEGAERFTAYLIAHDLRRKPVLVLPEHTRVTPPAKPDQNGGAL